MKVSEIAVVVLSEFDEALVCFYSNGITDEIYDRAWGGEAHPLDKAKKVINALERETKKDSALFEKSFITVWGRKIRCFLLKENARKTAKTCCTCGSAVIEECGSCENLSCWRPKP